MGSSFGKTGIVVVVVVEQMALELGMGFFLGLPGPLRGSVGGGGGGAFLGLPGPLRGGGGGGGEGG